MPEVRVIRVCPDPPAIKDVVVVLTEAEARQLRTLIWNSVTRRRRRRHDTIYLVSAEKLGRELVSELSEKVPTPFEKDT
ncbi:hypothetical protein SAMN02745126_03984 [Enhydrobacter aerosaccus]|uniref:Uncharacterized protein n=1 Tax=Enhydrobacter aerosaccus TaxID=225324 RepID=A0A1T4RNT5_9HYPH|nr:hypothetical protein SAMN02745126_03984 [Enhydrobacter aerosaccus]